MTVSGVVMVSMIQDSKKVIEANLYNTCKNAEMIRPADVEGCWKTYEDVTGNRRP